MTAFGDLRSALAALRAGAFDFIIKPFTVEQVVEALRRARRHSAQSSNGASSDGAGSAAAKHNESPRHRESLEEVERQHIMLVLDAVSWNKAEAARTLGIDRATLYRKLRRYGIDAPS
jgi:DNA-binding NtrC family response regulator